MVQTILLIVFAPKLVFLKLGWYSGTGSDGPFIYTGFKPAFVIKNTEQGTDDGI